MIQHISGAWGAPPMLGTLGHDDPLWDDVTELAEAVLASSSPPDGFVRRQLPIGGAPADVYAGVADDRRPASTTVIVVVASTDNDRPTLGELRRRFGLTPREMEVALLLAARCSNKEIARKLAIANSTASRHTEKVMAKLGTSSRRNVAHMLDDAVRPRGAARYPAPARIKAVMDD
jgi:DNA-binding CsgD family transcriptional regulator